MAERGTPNHSTSRYVAIAALFTALGELMSDYQSSPEGERVQRWSEDAERITGEVARHLDRSASPSRVRADDTGPLARL
jgi:hypothetical protein